MYKEIIRSGVDLVHRNIVYPYLTSGKARQDREIAHERALALMEKAQQSEILMRIFGHLYEFEDPIVATTFAGYELRNPIGLAAGFDKDVRVFRFLESLGLGAIKEGSICLLSWGGNERPRVYTLPDDLGLINSMGFPGNGAAKAEDRLSPLQRESRKSALVVNIAASKPSFVNEQNAIQDYLKVAKQLLRYGDWHEVNISSPNTPGVRGLQEPEVFIELAFGLQRIYVPAGKSFTYKFSPDLDEGKLLKDVRIAKDSGASGVVVANTTTDAEIRNSLRSPHKNKQGGISGRPLTKKSLEVSHRVHNFIGGELEVNRAGGVVTSEDLWEALTYGGAKIVDIYTAFIVSETSRPSLFHNMVKDLAEAMRAYGMKSMEDFRDLQGRRVPFTK